MGDHYESYDNATPAQASYVPPSGVQSTVMPSTSFSDMPGAMRDKKVALRVVEFFCAIIGLACTAGAVTNIFRMGYHSFHVFVFVMAFIFDAVFLIVYTRGHTLPSNVQGLMPKIEVGISALWSLFFFAGSIAYAVNLNELKLSQPDWNFHAANAGATFGFFSWILWSVSTFFAVQRLRGEASGGSMAYSDL